MLRHYVVPAMQNEMHPRDLYEGFTKVYESSARAESRTEALQQRLAKERNEFDLHQTPQERMLLVQSWPHESGTAELVDGDESALSLLDPAAKSADVAVAMWATKLLDKRTEPREWQEITDEVFSAKSYLTATIPFTEGETAQEQLDQMLTWASDGDWTDLDAALEPFRKKKQTTEEARSDWVHAVVVEAAAASDSYHWMHNWDGPPVLTHSDGTAFDAGPIADLVLAGDIDAAQAALSAAA